VVFWLMVDDIAPGVISREATYQLQPHSDSFPGVISFESIRDEMRPRGVLDTRCTAP